MSCRYECEQTNEKTSQTHHFSRISRLAMHFRLKYDIISNIITTGWKNKSLLAQNFIVLMLNEKIEFKFEFNRFSFFQLTKLFS